jgi:hypothetical protein
MIIIRLTLTLFTWQHTHRACAHLLPTFPVFDGTQSKNSDHDHVSPRSAATTITTTTTTTTTTTSTSTITTAVSYKPTIISPALNTASDKSSSGHFGDANSRSIDDCSGERESSGCFMGLEAEERNTFCWCGYDFIVDPAGVPWVLEVNIKPFHRYVDATTFPVPLARAIAKDSLDGLFLLLRNRLKNTAHPEKGTGWTRVEPASVPSPTVPNETLFRCPPF